MGTIKNRIHSYQRKLLKKFSLIVLWICLGTFQFSISQEYKWSNAQFDVQFSKDGLTTFKTVTDSVNLIAPNHIWGNIGVNYRVKGEDWNSLKTNFTRHSKINANLLVYKDSIFDMPLYMNRTYYLDDDGVHLKVEIGTTVDREIELGDVIFPIYWNGTDRNKNLKPVEVFEGTFLPKQSISLNSSFISFSKPSGKGPFYMMLTNEGTPLEYFDTQDNTYKVYVHAKATGTETEGNWRVPHTSVLLAPQGKSGSKVTYNFTLTAASKYSTMRDTLYNHGLLDVRAAPGYTIPRDLDLNLAIRVKGTINAIVPEFPQLTKINFIGKGDAGYNIYNVQFSKLGENMLTVKYNNTEQTVLEFFCTEPLETLIKKRSSFIVNKQQHKAPGKWWDGLYSVYDMKYNKLRGPEDTDGFDGWWGYVIACDDPILGKAPFVAAKNVVYPNEAEIQSLEYHLEHFVWGGLQRTDEEKPYPYGVYGVPNWYVSRNAKLHEMVFPNDDKAMQIWRAYDYPHLIKLYYHMYQIAQNSPEQVNYLNAEGYLQRAAETAKAYYKYPYEIWSWFDTYKWGIYNEKIILDVIAALEKSGNITDADFLRNEWEKKAKYFIYDDAYPYRSEHSFDRTAFESSYALAKYAVENPMQPDTNLWFDKNKQVWYSHPEVHVSNAKKFMEQQHNAALAIRGWLMPKYYLAGADCASYKHTGDLSYMSIMGGWSILDYGLFYSTNKDWLELGYNSYLSSWALMNTGDQDSDYGYWYAGKERDGASGWSFNSAKNGIPWYGKYEERGTWRYDGEIDLGYGAAFHTARTIVVKDSVFGWHAYGGNLKIQRHKMSVIPRDGVRQQFSYINSESTFHLSLSTDGFKDNVPVTINSRTKKINFIVENRALNTSGLHDIDLRIKTNKLVPKSIYADSKKLTITKEGRNNWVVEIPVSKEQIMLEIHWE